MRSFNSREEHAMAAGLAYWAVAISLRVAAKLVNNLERAVGGTWDDRQRHVGNSAVVVLSYAVHADGAPTPVLAARIGAAIQLASDQRLALVFSGGSLPPRRPDNSSDAELMSLFSLRCYSAQMRLVRRHWLEGASQNTRENALCTLALLRDMQPRLQALHIVTSRFHARRACRAFEVAAAQVWSSPPQISCSPVPAPTSAALDAPLGSCKDSGGLHERAALLLEVAWLCAREIGGLAKYSALGWI
jgi:uncharacterized SAM-binding protein YcdF (DUF218 family)